MDLKMEGKKAIVDYGEGDSAAGWIGGLVITSKRDHVMCFDLQKTLDPYPDDFC